jgi:hypothetical protein
VEYAGRAEQRAASGTWKALHELFLYLEGRDELDAPAAVGHLHFHPGIEYKRLLLIGALVDYRNTARTLLEVGPKLREWAAASVLRRDVRVIGESNLLLLDLGADAPPHRARPGGGEPYRGWVLEPARAYTDYLELYSLRERRQTARV